MGDKEEKKVSLFDNPTFRSSIQIVFLILYVLIAYTFLVIYPLGFQITRK